jgi:hypothetical protein
LEDSDSDEYDAKKATRNFLRTYLDVENQSTIIKDKVYNKPSKDRLYDLSKWEKISQRENKPSKIDSHEERKEELDEEEEQKIAFQQLYKYKQDNNIFKKDIDRMKYRTKNVQNILEDRNSSPPKNTKADDIALKIELRHKERKEQKEKRKREIMERKEEENRKRLEENRRLKANLDLEGVIIEPRKELKSLRKTSLGKSKPKHLKITNPTNSEIKEIERCIINNEEISNERLQKLRQKRETIEQDWQKDYEEVQKISEIIRKECEELKKIDRMKKLQQIEKERIREMEKERRRLEQERINAEKDMKRTRANKMYNTLNRLFVYQQRRTKKLYFSEVKKYSENVQMIVKKHLFEQQFKTKSKVYQIWKNFAYKQAQDKLFQKYKEDQLKEKLNMERAAVHHKQESQRKFFEAFKKWYEHRVDEKRIEQEHEQKLQIFLENMKKKAKEQKMQNIEVEIESQSNAPSELGRSRRIDFELDDSPVEENYKPVNIDVEQNWNEELDNDGEDREDEEQNNLLNEEETTPIMNKSNIRRIEENKSEQEELEEQKLALSESYSTPEKSSNTHSTSKESPMKRMTLQSASQTDSNQKRAKW